MTVNLYEMTYGMQSGYICVLEWLVDRWHKVLVSLPAWVWQETDVVTQIENIVSTENCDLHG